MSEEDPTDTLLDSLLVIAQTAVTILTIGSPFLLMAYLTGNL